MEISEFRRIVTRDEVNLLDDFVRILSAHNIRFCVIGGQAVNAYVEPLVSLDLDVVIAADQLEDVSLILPSDVQQERFPHSLNLSRPGSALRIQLQLDRRYAAFLTRAQVRDVLGARLPVAALEDVLQGKVWAADDPSQRGSRRQKDLADIARLLERFPELRQRVPKQIRDRLV